jgi:EmrB/QacA subfamily drug resistance transporter
MIRSSSFVYKWLAFSAVITGIIAGMMAGVSINIAIPDILKQYLISHYVAQWLSTLYIYCSAIAMLLSGWISSRIGIRNTVLLSMALLVLGSILGGLSESFYNLLIGRALQGLSAGIIAPLALVIVYCAFPTAKQGFAIGISGVGVVLAPGIGMYLSGYLISEYHWSSVFYVGLPMALLCILLTVRYLPKNSVTDNLNHFNWLSFISLSGLLLLLLVFAALPESNNREMWVFVVVMLIILAGSLFFYSERNARNTLVYFSLPAGSDFIAQLIVTFIAGAGLYGSYYLIPAYLQIVHGLSPVETGNILLFSSLLLVLIFPVSGLAADRYDSQILIIIGILMFALSSMFLAMINNKATFLILFLLIAVSRIGLGVVAPSLATQTINSLPREKVSHGSGLMNFIRLIGGTCGVILVSATWTHYNAGDLIGGINNICTEINTATNIVEPISSNSCMERQRQGTSAAFYILCILFICSLLVVVVNRMRRSDIKK